MARAWVLLLAPIVGAAVGAFTIQGYPGLLPGVFGGAALGAATAFVLGGLVLAGMAERGRDHS